MCMIAASSCSTRLAVHVVLHSHVCEVLCGPLFVRYPQEKPLGDGSPTEATFEEEISWDTFGGM